MERLPVLFGSRAVKVLGPLSGGPLRGFGEGIN